MNKILQNRNQILLSVLTILAMFAISGAAWVQIPADAQIPTHFGPDGQPDAWGSKFEGLMMMPIVTAFAVGLLAIVPAIEPRNSNLQNSTKAFRAIWTGLLIFFLVFHTAIVLMALGNDVPLNLILSVAVGGLFMVIGNFLSKTRSTFMFGIRTPWTLSSELAWTKTHRLGGKIFFFGGLFIAISGIFAPNLLIFAILGTALGGSLVTMVYSYFVWKSDPEAQAST